MEKEIFREKKESFLFFIIEESDFLGILLKLGIAILAGLVGGKIANKLKLPSVSGYIVAGLLLGPSLVGVFSGEDIDSLGIINDIALAAIAFGIGNEFLISDMEKVGKDAFIITLAEVLGAVLMVFLVMFFVFRQSFVFSLIIASMSAATAPAGLVMVINELKADGPLVRTILPVAAFDDALGIMVFGVAISIAKTLSAGGSFSILKIVGSPLLEIIGSVLLGLIIGIIMTYFASKAKGEDQLLMTTAGFILLGTGLAKFFNVSELLTCMVMGGAVVNSTNRYKRIFSTVNKFTPPINLLFFTLAGASIDISILGTVGLLGIGYIVARGLGKGVGATLGARAVDADETVVKYLGMSLLTQGGISIGLSMNVRNQMPELGDSIVTVILFSVLIFEILGPILTKIAITKAGEVDGRTKGL